MIEKMENISEKFQRAASAAGGFPNAIVKFLSVAFGNNTGKLLSLTVVFFGIYIMWQGFFGQVRTVSHLIALDNPTPEQSAEIRQAYNDAMSSVSVPLGVLVGAIPTIIGIGLMNKKNKEEESIPEVAATTEVEPDIKY